MVVFNNKPKTMYLSKSEDYDAISKIPTESFLKFANEKYRDHLLDGQNDLHVKDEYIKALKTIKVTYGPEFSDIDVSYQEINGLNYSRMFKYDTKNQILSEFYGPRNGSVELYHYYSCTNFNN